jgi:hypothetical protein
MRSLDKNNIELTIARIFATLVVGIFFGHFAGQIAAHFGYHFDPRMDWAIGLLSAAGTWFASRKVFIVLQQTEDTMKVPTAPTPVFLHDAGKKPGEKSAAGGSCSTGKCGQTREICGGCNAELKTEPQPDGSVKVTITVSGLSKREWDNFRERIENSKNVPDTSWSFPVNLGNRKRVITGTVKPGNGQKQALRKLEELTGKRV